MTNESLDELMARMARTRVPRRSFLAAAGLIGGSAALAACSPSGSASSAPSAGASTAASAAPTDSAAASASAAAAGPIEDELWMLNWSGYVDPGNMESFKAEFGVKNFQYDIFANSEELLAKLAGGASGYDMCCPTAEFLPQMAEQGYIQKLDYSRIPNFKYIDPAVLSQKWDPKNEYHVPKDFGSRQLTWTLTVTNNDVNVDGDTSQLVAYATSQAHSSIEKGLRIAGVGTAQTRVIPHDAAFAMVPDALAAQIATDRAAGLTPFWVCATRGTTSTMAFDPVTDTMRPS